MAEPLMFRRSSNTRPSISLDRAMSMLLPTKWVEAFSREMPRVPSNTWSTTRSPSMRITRP